jgi:broad specificity phosphatase PhoE
VRALPTIVLVRHGQASYGEADYDVLSPTGVRQAAHVAQVLQAGGLTVDRVLSGALGRQRGTAEPIAAAFGHPVEVDPRWDEYDSDDIMEHHSDHPARQHRTPGSDAPALSSREFQVVLERALVGWLRAGSAGPAREPWPRFNGRVTAALADLGAGLGPGQTGVVCTSGGVLAAVGVALLAVPATTFVAFNRVTVNVGLTRIAYGRSGATLLAFNEQGHLTGHDGTLLTYR